MFFLHGIFILMVRPVLTSYVTFQDIANPIAYYFFWQVFLCVCYFS